MFSPSLISIMIHSPGPDQGPWFTPPTFPFKPTSPMLNQSLDDLVQQLLNAVAGRPVGWPAIPVSGRTSRPIDLLLDKTAQTLQFRQFEKNYYFWGRVPLNLLVNLFGSSYRQPAH